MRGGMVSALPYGDAFGEEDHWQITESHGRGYPLSCAVSEGGGSIPLFTTKVMSTL